MSRLDVYPMPPNGPAGYLLDVQAELLSGLATRAVVPLLPRDKAPPPIADLNPALDIAGTPHLMLTQAIASIPSQDLKRPVASLAADHDRILRALDTLLVGF